MGILAKIRPGERRTPSSLCNPSLTYSCQPAELSLSLLPAEMQVEGQHQGSTPVILSPAISPAQATISKPTRTGDPPCQEVPPYTMLRSLLQGTTPDFPESPDYGDRYGFSGHWPHSPLNHCLALETGSPHHQPWDALGSHPCM